MHLFHWEGEIEDMAWENCGLVGIGTGGIGLRWDKEGSIERVILARRILQGQVET